MISIRKINSILVVIMLLIILTHATLSVLYLYGFISYSPNFQITGRKLFYPLILHSILSVYLYIKDKTRKVKIYPKLISETKQQIITGIGIFVFASLHIITYMISSINTNFSILMGLTHFLIDNAMFISIILHLRVSMPRLAISLGFLETKNSYVNFKEKFNKFIIMILILLVLAEIIHYLVLI